MKKNEVQHYPEIMNFIEMQLKSNFASKGIKNVRIFWKSGELKTKIQELVIEEPKYCFCLRRYSDKLPPLNLDIFAIITNGSKFELLILEIKLRQAVGLAEWSQLIGYNLVSNARYGMLINIDNEASSRLQNLLSLNHDLSMIRRVKESGEQCLHELGFMRWNSITKNFEYSNLGSISSLSALTNKLLQTFS